MGDEQSSPEPIIQTEVCDDGITAQSQTVEANSQVTAQELYWIG